MTNRWANRFAGIAIGWFLIAILVYGAAEGGADKPRRNIAIARQEYFHNARQMGCVKRLWLRESGWHSHADNPTSSAYGIPQMLLSYMPARAERAYKRSAEVQIRRGRGYIDARYGSACRALSFWGSHGYY